MLSLDVVKIGNEVADLSDDWKRAGELENDDALSDVTSSRRLHRDLTDDV